MSSTSVDPRVDPASSAGTISAGEAKKPSAGPRHRWWGLAVIGLAQLMVVLDATIVNIALPSAQKDLAFSNDGRQWIVTAYALAFGSLLLLGGRLADLFGRRNTFLIGLVGFAAASALGGAANGFTMLVVARALQGVFGALLAPSALSLLTTTFVDPKERSKAFGIFGAIAGSGGAIGLLLGGILTEHLDWRWTLYVNLVIAVFAVAGALVFLARPPRAPRPRLDLLGTLLVAGGLFCVVYGFSNAETHSWGSWMCWAFLAVGGVLLASFVLWERVAAHPLLPLRVLADRNRAGSYLSVFISGAGMFGVFLFLTYYLQGTLGYSPVKTGLAFLPMIGALMVMAQLGVNILIPRIGPKVVVPIGMALAAGGMAWLTGLDLDSTYAAHVLPPLLVMGLGLGMVMPSAMSLATLGVAPHDQGVASATVNTMQQVGGAIGTALFNTMATTALTSYAKDHAGMRNLTAHATLHSYSTAYWWAAAFFAAGLVIAVVVYRKGRPALQAAAAAAKAEDAGEDVDALPTVEQPAAAAATPRDAVPGFRPAPSPAAASAARPAPVPGATGFHGRVLAGRGTPVAEAAVTLVDPNGRQVGRTVSGPDGHYAVEAPAGGTYLLVGSAAGYHPEVATRTVGATPMEHDLVLGGASGGLAGSVRGPSGAVAGAVVVATDAGGEVVGSAVTETDGGYQLPDVPPGVYTLTVSAAGHRPSAGPVEVTGGGPTRHETELAPAASIRGTVRNRGGAPLDDARVMLLDPAGNVVTQRTTGPDGAYAFGDLAGGEYTVVASGYPTVAESVPVGDEPRDDVDVVLGHDLD